MTLIACLHPNQSRTLFADILISTTANGGDLVLPSRAYVSLDRTISMRPDALRRKVIEIAPELVILWAGEYCEAHQLAVRATEWFGNCAPTQDSVLQLLEAHYRVSIPNFWAIIAPATENWYYILGDVQKGASPSCGEYAVAGTGTSIFRGLVNETRLREGDILSTDLTALRLANELLAREIITGETIHALFGGGYEVLYRDSHGFQRIDDVLHIFSQIFVTNDGFCENFLLYAHQIRQWYEEDRLYLVSLSLTDEARQGLPSKGFVVPGVLGQEIPPTCVPDFTKRPKYVCVHQQFEFQGRKIPCNLALRGESIDKYFIIGKAGSDIRFEFTSLYRDWVHDFCRRIATTCAGTSV